jgi:hypothetical protein
MREYRGNRRRDRQTREWERERVERERERERERDRQTRESRESKQIHSCKIRKEYSIIISISHQLMMESNINIRPSTNRQRFWSLNRVRHHLVSDAIRALFLMFIFCFNAVLVQLNKWIIYLIYLLISFNILLLFMIAMKINWQKIDQLLPH